MGKRKTTEQFIEEARQVHGDKYDYSKVEYVNNHTEVCIICPEHGEFRQTPNKHINRQHGCQKCGGTQKKTLEEFVTEAKEVHGDKYDYSKVEYKGVDTDVVIICPIHGEFTQTPWNHVHSIGCGCIQCNNDKMSKERSLSKEEFIKRACLKHGNKYDYSKVIYNGIDTEVTIICPIHGEHKQTPWNHLKGCGCEKCSHIERGLRRRLGKEKFIERARKIHGDKYMYNNVNYLTRNFDVLITCPIHGDFPQTPNNHLGGKGCPECKKSILEDEIEKMLDDIGLEFIKQYKDNDLKYIKLLSIDFYIPDLNIAIECQGGQHFEPIEYFGGEKIFKIQKIRDEIKKKFCDENKIDLLYYTKHKGVEENETIFKNIDLLKEYLVNKK